LIGLVGRETIILVSGTGEGTKEGYVRKSGQRKRPKTRTGLTYVWGGGNCSGGGGIKGEGTDL